MENLTDGELRRVQVGILEKVDGFCRDNDITYYLAYGTLLGAVRHHGYIPWDDDVDLMMQRADYDRFLALFPRAGATLGLSLGAAETREDWPFPYAKVSDDRTDLQEATDVRVPLGVNVDVFPVDAVPPSRGLRSLQRAELGVYRRVLVLQAVSPRTGQALHRRLVLRLTKPFARLLSTPRLVGRVTSCARRHNRAGSPTVGVRVGSFDWSVPAAALGAPVEVAFEGRTYPGPHDAHLVLTTLYGEYLTWPPASQRTTHHRFSATWREAR